MKPIEVAVIAALLLVSPGGLGARAADLQSARPAPQFYRAQDGTELAYRYYPAIGGERQVAILIHGSAGQSQGMHDLAQALVAQGVSVYAPDIRGHGASGPRGDIAYIGQLEDDLEVLSGQIRAAHPGKPVTLVGFSAGGAFGLRVAGGPHASVADRYVIVSPALNDVARRGRGGWAKPDMPRIVLLMLLNKVGVHRFDGAEVIRFAVPQGRTDMTPAYSYRLMVNFAALDDKARMARVAAPMTLIAGAADEQFDAAAYGPRLTPCNPQLKLRLLPGVRHYGMASDPRMIAGIAAQFYGETVS